MWRRALCIRYFASAAGINHEREEAIVKTYVYMLRNHRLPAHTLKWLSWQENCLTKNDKIVRMYPSIHFALARNDKCWLFDFSKTFKRLTLFTFFQPVTHVKSANFSTSVPIYYVSSLISSGWSERWHFWIISHGTLYWAWSWRSLKSPSWQQLICEHFDAIPRIVLPL